MRLSETVNRRTDKSMAKIKRAKQKQKIIKETENNNGRQIPMCRDK